MGTWGRVSRLGHRALVVLLDEQWYEAKLVHVFVCAIVQRLPVALKSIILLCVAALHEQGP